MGREEAPGRPAGVVARGPWTRGRAAEDDKPQELGMGATNDAPATASPDGPPEEMTSLAEPTVASRAGHVPEHFSAWFWGLVACTVLILGIYYWRMDGQQLPILKELIAPVVPLRVLTVV